MHITARELFEESAKYEYTRLAHCLFYMFQEGLAKPDDRVDTLNFDAVDQKKVDEMSEKNILGINHIKVFSLKIDKDLFLFVFARDEQEAKKFVSSKLQRKPLNCHEYWLGYEMQRGNEVISFRDMRKEHTSFPAIAGFFKR